MFGLPFSTSFFAFGVPVLIVLALIWWGIRFHGNDDDGPGTREDSEQ
jgi:hypothetical protein